MIRCLCSGRGVVCVSDAPVVISGLSTLQSREIGRVIEGNTLVESLDQVGMENPVESERDGIDLPFCDKLLPFFRLNTGVEIQLGILHVVSVRLEDIVLSPSLLAIEFDIEKGVVAGEGDVAWGKLVDFRDEVSESLKSFFEGHTDIVVATGRVELDSDVRTVDFFGGLEDFEAESRTVLYGTTPLVCALVDSAVEELVDKVAVGAVDFTQD